MVVKNSLELKNINFFYKKNNLILNDLNVVFYPGCITAMLGINGSGKTTLFKILTGINYPTLGHMIYDEKVINNSNIIYYKALVGFMPEFLQLYKDMTVCNVLHLLSSLKGYDNFDIDPILHIVYLFEHRNKKVKALSKGMKQRLNLAQAIIGNPKIVLFDEPSNGFDCGSILMFYDVLRNLSNAGSIVLISSHHLSEIYNNVDKVLILSSGKIIKELDIRKTFNDNQFIYKYIWIYFENNLNITNLEFLFKKFVGLKLISDNLLHGKFHNKNVVFLLTDLINFNVNIIDIRIEDRILEETLIELS